MAKKLVYKNLSHLERRVICNGCGRKSGFIPVPEFKFTASCNQHDFNYWLGGSEADRLKADYQFYVAMKHDATYDEEGNKRNFLVRRYYLTWAYIYYKAVRTCGGNKKLGGFNYRDVPRTWKDLDNEVQEFLRKSKERGHILYIGHHARKPNRV